MNLLYVLLTMFFYGKKLELLSSSFFINAFILIVSSISYKQKNPV